MENTMSFLKKLKIELSYNPEIPLLGVHLKKWKYYPNIHNSTIYNSQDMEAMQAPINRWLD